MPHYGNLNFRWSPEQTIDTKALDRMRENFPKPAKLPPVAWFMSGIEYYETVSSFPEMDISKITRYLQDTGSGIRSFGRLKIWVDWFLYMLPYLIEKSLELGTASTWLFCSTVEFFFRLYPHEIHEEYLGFIHDLFPTLLNISMNEKYWKDGDLIFPDWAGKPEKIDDYNPEWYEAVVGSHLECSLEFCVKYLPESDLADWVESVAEINGEYWKLQIKYWLTQLKNNPENYHVPEERAKLFLDELRKYPNYQDI